MIIDNTKVKEILISDSDGGLICSITDSDIIYHEDITVDLVKIEDSVEW